MICTLTAQRQINDAVVTHVVYFEPPVKLNSLCPTNISKLGASSFLMDLLYL
jgi:hypothetical protein